MNFIWKQKKNYGFLKLTLSNNSYNYKDASSIEMCILNYLLTSDMSYDLSFWKEWVFDDSVEGVCGNLTSLEKEKNSIIITDMYSEEEVPTELEITFDQYLQLLDDWEEKVIKKKPKEVIIKYENDRFIIETQD